MVTSSFKIFGNRFIDQQIRYFGQQNGLFAQYIFAIKVASLSLKSDHSSNKIDYSNN
jgi:hypothetical protein